MSSKKQIVERILNSDFLMENLKMQIKINGRYLITNGCVALIIADAIPGIPMMTWEDCNSQVQAMTEKVYNLAFNPIGFEHLYGKLDVDKLKQYEKENRFSESLKRKATMSGWISFDGIKYPIKQVIDFLGIIKDANLSNYGQPLIFWNGKDAGLIMPCAVADYIIRYDKEGNVTSKYSVSYKGFVKD